MATFKIVIDRPACIGCENCVSICPAFWEMASDGLAHLIGSESVGENEEREMDDAACNLEAAEGCPVTCIHVYEKGEKRI